MRTPRSRRLLAALAVTVAVLSGATVTAGTAMADDTTTGTSDTTWGQPGTGTTTGVDDTTWGSGTPMIEPYDTTWG